MNVILSQSNCVHVENVIWMTVDYRREMGKSGIITLNRKKWWRSLTISYVIFVCSSETDRHMTEPNIFHVSSVFFRIFFRKPIETEVFFQIFFILQIFTRVKYSRVMTGHVHCFQWHLTASILVAYGNYMVELQFSTSKIVVAFTWKNDVFAEVRIWEL